ncbi:MAG: Fur family transcriptional regulator [Candidatus Dadabacteria bacterium]|nr:Fur family transcriptional regulator [Candidatus Dadabacteria bacterium]
MIENKDNLEKLIGLSKEKGLKLTPQRMVIFRILSESKQHVTVDQVYKRARVEYPMLSPATVYRNMEQMVETGLLTHLELSGASMRYDTNLDEHHHFVCSKCGRVTDVYLDNINYSLDESRSALGKAQINSLDLHLQGTCGECL